MFLISRHLGAAGLLLALLAVQTGKSSAQEKEEPPRFSVSIRLGLTLSTLRFQDPNANDQTRIRPGFHVGAGAVVALGRHAQAEGLLLYSQGGFGGRGGHPASLRTGFLELPVLLRVRPSWRVSPHLVAGFVPRIRIHCGLSEVGQVGRAACDDPVVGTHWKRFDLASLGGLGVTFGVGEGTVVMEGMIEWGLVDMKSDPLPPGWARSADLRFSTAFQLPIGEER